MGDDAGAGAVYLPAARSLFSSLANQRICERKIPPGPALEIPVLAKLLLAWLKLVVSVFDEGSAVRLNIVFAVSDTLAHRDTLKPLVMMFYRILNMAQLARNAPPGMYASQVWGTGLMQAGKEPSSVAV
eukprot:1144427-Pelagomonas_calceolata.AAC.2